MFDFEELEEALQRDHDIVRHAVLFDAPVVRQPIRCVIFDLFGTLVFMSRKRLPWTHFFGRIEQECVKQGLGRFDLNASSKFAQTTNGPPCEVAMQAVLSQLPAFKVEAFQELFHELDFEENVRVEAASTVVFDDTFDTLERLRKDRLKLALVSNLATPYAGTLELCGLHELFDVVVFSFAEGAMKGEPNDHRIYNCVASRLNSSLDSCLFVGDTVDADYDGPLAAGMQAVHLDRRMKRQERARKPRPTIATLAELVVIA